MWRAFKKSCVYRIVQVLMLTSLVLSCSAPPPTNSPGAPKAVNTLQGAPLLLAPKSFHTQAAPTYPIPTCEDPTEITLTALNMGYKRSVSNKYGYFPPAADFTPFTRGFINIGRENGQLKIFTASFETNDGPNWYVLGNSGIPTGTSSYAEDFSVTLPNDSVVFIYSNEYASDIYVGARSRFRTRPQKKSSRSKWVAVVSWCPISTLGQEKPILMEPPNLRSNSTLKPLV